MSEGGEGPKQYKPSMESVAGKPLTPEEEENRKRVGADLAGRAARNDAEGVSEMRRQIIDATEAGVISPDDAIDTALPSEKPSESETK